MSPPIAADFSALRIQVDATDPGQTVGKQWVLSSLLNLLQSITPGKAQTEALGLIHRILSTVKPTTLQVGDANLHQITRLFDLEFSAIPWVFGDEPYEVPSLLVLNLKNLKLAFYDDACETSCRIAVDYVIVAAKLQLRDLHPLPPRPKRRRLNTSLTPTDPVSILLPPPTDTPAPLPLCVFPELELAVTIIDPHNPSRIVRVAGRADWALGYGTREDALSGAVLIAVEAKRRENFGQAEAQLLTYLAVLRQLRLSAAKTNPVVQGFFTDGARYTFLAITNEGVVQRSRPYEVNVNEPADVKTVFNFIVTQMETACRSTPTTSPLKGEEGELDVRCFGRRVWEKAYGRQNAQDDELEILMEGEGEGELQEMPAFA